MRFGMFSNVRNACHNLTYEELKPPFKRKASAVNNRHNLTYEELKPHIPKNKMICFRCHNLTYEELKPNYSFFTGGPIVPS